MVSIDGTRGTPSSLVPALELLRLALLSGDMLGALG